MKAFYDDALPSGPLPIEFPMPQSGGSSVCLSGGAVRSVVFRGLSQLLNPLTPHSHTHTHTYTHFSRWSTEAVHCGRALQLRLLWHINRWHRPPTSAVRRPKPLSFIDSNGSGICSVIVRSPQKLTRVLNQDSGYGKFHIPLTSFTRFLAGS